MSNRTLPDLDKMVPGHYMKLRFPIGVIPSGSVIRIIRRSKGFWVAFDVVTLRGETFSALDVFLEELSPLEQLAACGLDNG